ncbi:septum formation inhibitor-activating ATPase [Novosphingobium album (ex Liu et al. 2023)]|uniref:Septum formation inhibitor-activating ATPase n=1 Tax=Novosphingobium album (ex Liu et al. 2023) TaxID=3031130 RepID=A0ABT5WXL5_9SPHN|nr:septum formation inhibitor-activating ATPase [Novosphingobium album (ex Liu et al. 2023)]MDE8654656.1 septum formation inhibitor-activating ATPase [Novosphingobium album (ex Liu et al. 2023)]
MADLSALLEIARGAGEPRPVDKSKVDFGGVDPLGLRQINFGLMDRVLPDLNNVASHIRPYTLMAWAWRRVRHILERGKKQSAAPEDLRDFVDRIEAIYAWSQFLIDPRADIPGAQAMRSLLDTAKYRFGGDEWAARRNMRRYSTGLISPLNYGPSLRTMGWLLPVEGAAGIFQPDPSLDAVLDAFEKRFESELGHEAFNRFGSVVVERSDAERWGKLWALEEPRATEAKAMFARLGGERAAPARQKGIALIQAAFADLGDEEATYEDIRLRMADRAEAWNASEDRPAAADEWRAVQVRQLFRLCLEGLFYWSIGQLMSRSLSTAQLAQVFISALDEGSLPEKAEAWLLASSDTANPVAHLRSLQAALRDQDRLPSAIVAGLKLCLREAPSQAHPFENTDRLPLSRAKREAERWRDLPPTGFVGRMLDIWIMAQHAYWSVGRGLADARNRGKTILRLRIVMDEGGWSLTPGTTRQGNPPEPTPDRLETAVSLLMECGRL